MKKSVGCFTDEKIRELAQQPNVTVMQPTHDVVYEPWNSTRVTNAVTQLVTFTNSVKGDLHKINQYVDSNTELKEFSEKYLVFYKKVTDYTFTSDAEHVNTMLKLISLRSQVERGHIDEQNAQAQCADISLKSLMDRVKKK